MSKSIKETNYMRTDRFYSELMIRYSNISKLVSILEPLVNKESQERLKINVRDGRVYYYITDPGSESGMRIATPRDMRLVRSSAQNSYHRKLLRTAKLELKILKYAAENYPATAVEDIYTTLSPERQALVKPIVQTDEQYKNEWLAVRYERKGFDEDAPVYMTIKGDRVRSKSEQIIADRLYVKGIPYRYEYPLKVGKRTIYPDFTILRMSNRKELYYEHYGKIDDPKYANLNVMRTNEYIRNGFLIGDRLFITLESSENPLDTRILDRMIAEQFS